jgi:hypothetical protein
MLTGIFARPISKDFKPKIDFSRNFHFFLGEILGEKNSRNFQEI